MVDTRKPRTPMTRVKEQFGGKAQLVDAILTAMGQSAPETRAKLMRVSNKRLLTHHALTMGMVERFRTKTALVDALVEARFAREPGDKATKEGRQQWSDQREAYRKKLAEMAPWRLMDLHRQQMGKRAGRA